MEPPAGRGGSRAIERRRTNRRPRRREGRTRNRGRAPLRSDRGNGKGGTGVVPVHDDGDAGPRRRGKGGDLAHRPEAGGRVLLAQPHPVGLLRVVVENVVNDLAGREGDAVPGLGFDRAPVVDGRPPQIHQHGGGGVGGPEAQANRAGAAVLYVENQLAQGDVPGAPRSREIHVVDLGRGPEVGGDYVGAAAVEADAVGGGSALLHRDGGRGAGSADVTLDAGTSRRSGWPLGQHKVQRHAGVGGGGGDSGAVSSPGLQKYIVLRSFQGERPRFSDCWYCLGVIPVYLRNTFLMKNETEPKPHQLMGYRLCVFASGSLITDIFSCFTLIKVSCLHFGQYRG